jgi:hypothetical protein
MRQGGRIGSPSSGCAGERDGYLCTPTPQVGDWVLARSAQLEYRGRGLAAWLSPPNELCGPLYNAVLRDARSCLDPRPS